MPDQDAPPRCVFHIAKAAFVGRKNCCGASRISAIRAADDRLLADLNLIERSTLQINFDPLLTKCAGSTLRCKLAEHGDDRCVQRNDLAFKPSFGNGSFEPKTAVVLNFETGQQQAFRRDQLIGYERSVYLQGKSIRLHRAPPANLAAHRNRFR